MSEGTGYPHWDEQTEYADRGLLFYWQEANVIAGVIVGTPGQYKISYRTKPKEGWTEATAFVDTAAEAKQVFAAIMRLINLNKGSK